MATRDDPFRDYCLELLSGVGACQAKRMFGGYGIGLDGMNFALIAFDQLWLKVDALSEATFEQAGCARFEYEAKGRTMSIGYRTVPAEAMDSPAAMLPWARLGLEAALRASAAKVRGPVKPRGPAEPRGPAKARGPTSKTARKPVSGGR